MTLILELTPEQEAEIEREAARHGTDARTYALEMLFPSSRREPHTPNRRKLGFARDMVGEFDLEAFNSVSLEEMGFEEYVP